MTKKLVDKCKGVFGDLSAYWRRYGGWSSLVTSPFVWAAGALTLICAPYWWSRNWWELSVSVVPAVLGFSIAAFALLLSIGDDTFKLRFGLVRKAGKPSTLTIIATSFFHFIVVQAIALALAFIGGARILSELLEILPAPLTDEWLSAGMVAAAKIFRAFGFFALAYSLTSALAAAMAIYRMALIYSTHATAELRRRARAGGEAAGIGAKNGSEGHH